MKPEHKKVAFYPCSADDFDESYAILDELVDEIIYCDLNISAQRKFNEQRRSFPKAQFILRDAVDEIKEIECIDVFFYRKDSNGEGGSALYFFGDKIFPFIVEKLNKNGALIISDGSNARGSNWRKMNRKNGVELYGRFFKPADEQRYLECRGNGPVICNS
jgi:hypothetical protein